MKSTSIQGRTERVCICGLEGGDRPIRKKRKHVMVSLYRVCLAEPIVSQTPHTGEKRQKDKQRRVTVVSSVHGLGWDHQYTLSHPIDGSAVSNTSNRRIQGRDPMSLVAGRLFFPRMGGWAGEGWCPCLVPRETVVYATR